MVRSIQNRLLGAILFLTLLITIIEAYETLLGCDKAEEMKCFSQTKNNNIKKRAKLHQRSKLVRIKDPCCDYEKSMSPEGRNKLKSMSCEVIEDKKNYYNWKKAVKIKNYPWVALLRYETPEKQFECAGSLITDRFVLTSASCVIDRKLLSVRLGEQNLNTNPDCERRNGFVDCAPDVEEFGIERIIPHPEFLGTIKDIALIKLNSTVNFKDHIKPICLPISKSDIEPLKKFRYFGLTGFGLTTEGFSSSILRSSSVLMANRSICKSEYKNTRFNNFNLCVKGKTNTSYCHADPGGSAFYFQGGFYRNTPTRFIQYGVIPYSAKRKSCPDNEKSLVLTNVAKMMPWITEQILK